MSFYTILRSTLWALNGYPAGSYSRLAETSEYWSREQLEHYRNEKLCNLIAHCYENVPYYRRVMDQNTIRPTEIKSPEDLVKLPVLTKDSIRRYSRALLAENISEMTVSWSKTGGTTGEPMRICKNRECSAWANVCYARGLRWGGLTVNEPRIKLFGGSLGIDKTRLTTRLGSFLRRDLFLPAFELRTDTAMSYFHKIHRSRCRFLLGYASSIYRLALLAEEIGEKIEFEAVFPTAELMLPEWEEVIRRKFNCAVLPYYGCGEVNSLGYRSLESDAAYLIPEEHALIEVVQSDGSIHLTGEGQFLITDLDNYAMPIIRYVNGDAGKISAPNGRYPFSRIERLDGRYNSLLMTDTGDLISGVIGTHVFRHLPTVESYRIIQEEPLRVVIEVVPRNGFSKEDEGLIQNLFQKHLGSRMKINVEKVPNIPRPQSGKSVFVINRCLETSSAVH